MSWKISKNISICCNKDVVTLLDKHSKEYYILSDAYKLLIMEFAKNHIETDSLISKYIKLFPQNSENEVQNIINEIIEEFKERRWIEYA